MIPGSGVSALPADSDAYFKRRAGAMPDQALTLSEAISDGLWDWMSK